MKRYVSILLAIIPIFSLNALNQQLRIGGERGWGEFYAQESVTRVNLSGAEYLVLESPKIQPGPATQLLLRFDELPSRDLSGGFRVQQDLHQLSTAEFKVGSAAGVFRGEPMLLQADQAVLFQPGMHFEGFTISFYLYAPLLREGEEIISWQGIDHRSNQRQQFKVSVQDRRLEFVWQNLFMDEGRQLQTFRLRSHDGLLPGRWSHHFVSYDPEDGRLAYYVDGQISDVSYVTGNRNGSGSPLPMYVGNGSSAVLQIGAGLEALIDELHISSVPMELPSLRRYSDSVGRVLLAPYQFESPRTKLRSFSYEHANQGDTDVRVLIRSGTQLDSRGNVIGEWVDSDLPDAIQRLDPARFVQLMVEVLPDGVGSNSPLLRHVDISYQELPPPIPPSNVRLIPGRESLRVEWSRVHDPLVGGYLVFFGTEPGRYFGTGDRNSPIDAGDTNSLEIGGLKPDTLYYVTVMSYDLQDNRLTSVFSREHRVRILPPDEMDL
ncbi:LamG-like jellyroll fold domain-containing protein [Spirochaeta dissipatitropha]